MRRRGDANGGDPREARVTRLCAGVVALVLLLVLPGCASTSAGTQAAVSVDPSASAEPSAERVASPAPSAPAASFPTAAFADIREEPVSREVAVRFQAALRDVAGDGGIAATVMSAEGTWSGAVGKADTVRDVGVHDQFAIASVTKPIVAAQVMQMVDAGELGLDDPATDHLPADLDFDTNGATIRQLLSQRSGIPDYYDQPKLQESLSTDRQRVWTPAELLELVPADRTPAGESFGYTDTNYLLLGLVIEELRGRPVGAVLRDGVLAIDGVKRLIYQPDEKPTQPMAMPHGKSTAELEKGGGYLPSLASATADGPGAAMASDAPSLARWWRAFCAGEIVSEASLNKMTAAPLSGVTTDSADYGLGIFNVSDPYAKGVGHTGGALGYVAWAGCLPADGLVVVVLHNQVVEDIGGLARSLVLAARSR